MTRADNLVAPGTESLEEVLGLFHDEAALYAKLESYAATQRLMITWDDPGPLLSLLEDRQRISVQLTEIAARLAPVRRDWEAYRTRLSPGQRCRAERLVRDTTERLHRVIQSDEQDARRLAVRKQSVVRALRAAHSAGEALSAYRGSADGARGIGHLDEAS